MYQQDYEVKMRTYILALLLVIALAGCTTDENAVSYADSLEDNTKSDLLKKIGKGSLTALAEDEYKLGEKEVNYIAIKNAYDQDREFAIESECPACIGLTHSVEIEAQGTAILGFEIDTSKPSNNTIKIKDENNNFYSLEEIMILG